MMSENELSDFIRRALSEDIGGGDHSSLASIGKGRKGRARLLAKETGIIAGIQVAKEVFRIADPSLKVTTFISDGAQISPGMVLLTVEGEEISILKAER